MALVHTAKLPVRAVSQDDAAMVIDEPVDPPRLLDVQPSREKLPMGDAFYTADSSAAGEDMSTTIIFNVFKGEPRALEQQLRAAAQQQKLPSAPEVWVMCFASPRQREYEDVVAKARELLPNLVFTASNFNHKFHGRFLLAYMATTKFVLIVDDDKMIDATTVFDYVQYMKRRPGVWGNNGHLRAPVFGGYKSWPSVGYDTRVDDMAEQDYLSGMWFLQQSWLEYFVKERVATWETSEDMHLSHVMRKYLNLNTYGGRVALGADKLPRKKHAATVGAALELREFVFDHQLGRGNKVANVVAPLRTLVFAETVEDIADMIAKLQSCRAETDIGGEDPRALLRGAAGDSTELESSGGDGGAAVVIDDDEEEQAPWCGAGKAAVVFRGAAEQDVAGMIAAAETLCRLTECEFVALKPKIQHPIRYFNMREGFGQADTAIPWQTAVADVITSLVGVLNNVQPQRFFFPEADSVRWREPEPDAAGASRKRNRLQIYHNAVRLALQIHVNSATNQKWDLRNLSEDAETAFPSDLRVFTWRKTAAPESAATAEGEREEDGVEGGEPLFQEFSFFE